MKIYNYDAIVIGSGAAGYNAACRIKKLGKKTVAIVTEDVTCGTSRNTGSDKQTYYKLGLCGDAPDSVLKMAENLFAGGCVDGDNALCEAALSARCFLNLAELGVEFPTNRYGEYVGYKTDHDPYARATSSGPLTSKYMTEALERHANDLGVEVFSGYLAIEILLTEGRVSGLLTLKVKSGELAAFRCSDIVLCTGGPAGIYADSVYPECHTGSSSLAILAGAAMQNLTEWQYGLSSINPRWNVSGTYMQVLPRFVSVDSDGCEHEFLSEYFADPYEALSAVFLKGYQWPFDSAKVLEGSSVIDLLVYRERTVRGRRVYLDFTKNPFGIKEIEYEKLSSEAYEYLKRADALFGTPAKRLIKMNSPAVKLYLDKGLDITKEYLEIALCAQHNNGGIAVDMWWQSSVKGLFAAGECAGTHGVTRPGGTALNAGQVGSLRAAQYISERGGKGASYEEFEKSLLKAAEKHEKAIAFVSARRQNTKELIFAATRKMSDTASAIRRRDDMEELLLNTESALLRAEDEVGTGSREEAYTFYKYKDILVCQAAYLFAMIDHCKENVGSRGSAIFCDEDGELRDGLEELFRFKAEDKSRRSEIQEISFTTGGFLVKRRPVRPIPKEDGFFENVWRTYRENKSIY